MSTIIPEEATDTPRRHLLTLAHRALGFPNMSVEDEVAMVSAIGDRKERGRLFDALCSAVNTGEPELAGSLLDRLLDDGRYTQHDVAVENLAAELAEVTR